jgi:serine/threonine protein phosphatase PrpC
VVSSLKYRVHGFGQHKDGLEPADWEDSIAVSRRTGRLAVSDGASSSFAAKQWSRLLVDAWVNDPLDDPTQWERWIATARARWVEAIAATANDLPAYLRAERSDHAAAAYATLVGAAIGVHPDGTASLRVVAVGDSVLFLVRDGEVVFSSPGDAMTMAFDSNPQLLGSTPDGPGGDPQPTFSDTLVQAGDMIVMASDAMAETLRDFALESNAVWGNVARLKSEHFPRLVEQLRAGRMVNDDVALIRAVLSAG